MRQFKTFWSLIAVNPRIMLPKFSLKLTKQCSLEQFKEEPN